MTTEPARPAESSKSRRRFLQTSAAILAGGFTVAQSNIASCAHAAGGDLLRVGLIGCGGRGTGAASQALKADENVQLTAVGDMFEDRLQLCLQSLEKIEEVSKKLNVPRERQFVGFDAYQQVIDSGVDVVLLATPPHFRPAHLRAAIQAGKHVFAEKPVAVDAPGVRSVLETCELATAKNLAVVSGLCLRYSEGFRALVSRLHDGAIGEIHTLQANDYRGPIWVKPRLPDWTDMHWQMRNWYYFTWLSGDFNVEQHVHFLDVCAWIMKDTYPESAVGMGGRQVRTGPEYGNIYDHHGVVYEYANGAKLFSNTRQMSGCYNDMSAHAGGARGAPSLSNVEMDCPSSATNSGRIQVRTTIFIRLSMTSCLPRSAMALRLTMGVTWPTAPCWPSWVAWLPIRVSKSPGTKRCSRRRISRLPSTSGAPSRHPRSRFRA